MIQFISTSPSFTSIHSTAHYSNPLLGCEVSHSVQSHSREFRLPEPRAVADGEVAEQEYSSRRHACEGLLQPRIAGRTPQLPELHQATSSSGNPILPGSPQWITPDTCLNHINPDGQREEASFAHSQRQTASEVPLMSYCYSDRV